MPTQAHVVRTLVELADSLVDDFDVVELLTRLADRSVEVLGAAAAGVMLAAPEGDLRVVASSSETMRLLELFELQADEGPCLDCYRSGEAVVENDLASAAVRWPHFAPVATEAGFGSAQAFPLRLRRMVIGALNLFDTGPGSLDATDLAVGGAFADVATIAVLQHQVVSEARLLADQLNGALSSRVVIEQAKGVLAERTGLSMEAAFGKLRRYARDHNLRLSDVAGQVVDRTLTIEVKDRDPGGPRP